MRASGRAPTFRSWAFLAFWALGALNLLRAGLAVDSYLVRVRREALPHAYDWPGVLAALGLISIEALLLYAVLRPESYRRSWGRALVATSLGATLTALSGLALMHASPVAFAHWVWLATATAACLALLVASAAAAWRERRTARSAAPASAARAAAWLADSETVLAEVYRPHSGAGGRYFLLRSPEDLKGLLENTPRKHLLFLARWAPLRRSHGQSLGPGLPEAGEYLVGVEAYYPAEFEAGGCSREELSELEDAGAGEPRRTLCVGPAPPFPQRHWRAARHPDVVVIRT